MFTINKRLLLSAFAIGALAVTLTSTNSLLAAGWIEDGKALYGKKCANCHALDGSGSTAKGKELKLKDLRSPEVQKMSDQQINDLISKGKGKMTGLGKTLSQGEIQALVAYTRELAKQK